MSIKKWLKLLVFALIFSVLTFSGCATKADASAENETAYPDELPADTPVPEEEAVTLAISSNDDENIDSELSKVDSDTENDSEKQENSPDGESPDGESENETADGESDSSSSDTENNSSEQETGFPSEREELPEIEEPLVRDAELPEEIIEVVPEPEPEPEPDPIPEEIIFVEEVPPLPEIVETSPAAEEPAPPAPEEEKQVEPPVEIEEPNPSADEVEDVDDAAVDITDEEEAPEEEVPEEIIPSRSVTLRIGEYLELDYPGKGWIYLGATDGSKNLTSAGRKLGEKDTNFTLLAKKEGTSILHFYKEDILAGVYIDDYIEVTVESTRSKSKTRIKAPSYAETVPKKPAAKKSEEPKPEQKIEQKSEQTYELKPEKTETPKTEQKEPPAPAIAPVPKPEPEPEPLPELSAEELIASAKSNFNAKKYDAAKRDLQIYMTVAEGGRDEALYMLGQIYESNSKEKDIKKAIETYEELMENYPVSKYWDEANKRVIYLKRFYINVR